MLGPMIRDKEAEEKHEVRGYTLPKRGNVRGRGFRPPTPPSSATRAALRFVW